MHFTTRSFHLSLAFGLVLGGARIATAQGVVNLGDIANGKWNLFNRKPVMVREGERNLLRFDENADAGLAWNPLLSLTDGDIDVDVRGRDVLQKSFVGVAFHIAADTMLEVFWLRPFNFASEDSARHAHAVQYASYPVHSWQKLRADHPGVYEAAVPASVTPDAWVHLHIEIRGASVKLFLNGATTPTLAVESLGGRTSGGVGLWVGAASNGDFANLKVVRK